MNDKHHQSATVKPFATGMALSLLWPSGAEERPSSPHLYNNSSHDLALDNTLFYFDTDHSHRQVIGRILKTMTMDPQVIRYRQDVLEDMIANPKLVQRFNELLPIFDILARYQFSPLDKNNVMQEVVWRAGELETLVECVNGLSQIFDEIGADLQSEGLQILCQKIKDIEQDEGFKNLKRELPTFLEELRSNVSVTIGVNLDRHLRPYEATLLSVNKERFTGVTLFNKLFGKGNGQGQGGLAALHSVEDYKGEKQGASDYAVTNVNFNPEPTMVPLFRDLAQVLEKVCKPILKSLAAYGQVNSRFLISLRKDLIFYLGAVQLIEKIKSYDLPLCRPEIVDKAERVYEVKENYNINLALHLSNQVRAGSLADTVVRNDVNMGDDGRVFILTGPNQGGKTTYLQAVGLAHILAQAGLPVPGTEARISPVDNIYTHYPVEEQLERGTGRFGDEAMRLQEIFEQATRHSLLLLNESLSSTNIGEALYLAQDVVRILCKMGTRAIFATHMHELAAGVSKLNEETSGDSQAISLVASLIDEFTSHQDDTEKSIEHSYKVVPSPPMGRSYAKELAEGYGISFEQLTAVLQQRGVI